MLLDLIESRSIFCSILRISYHKLSVLQFSGPVVIVRRYCSMMRWLLGVVFGFGSWIVPDAAFSSSLRSTYCMRHAKPACSLSSRNLSMWPESSQAGCRSLCSSSKGVANGPSSSTRYFPIQGQESDPERNRGMASHQLLGSPP